VTHGPRGDIVSLYTTFPWPAVCEEIAKLRIELREGELVPFPASPTPATRYTAVTGAERARRRWKFPVTPSGLETETGLLRLSNSHATLHRKTRTLQNLLPIRPLRLEPLCTVVFRLV